MKKSLKVCLDLVIKDMVRKTEWLEEEYRAAKSEDDSIARHIRLTKAHWLTTALVNTTKACLDKLSENL